MLCDTLRILRESRNLTQKEVAAKLGVSLQVYNNYERGITKIPTDTLKALRKVLNYSADYILDYEQQTEQEYNENFKAASGIVNYLNRNEKNKSYMLWLSNEWEGDTDLLISMSVKYACCAPALRATMQIMCQAVFDYEYLNNANMPLIADEVHNSEQCAKVFDVLYETRKGG